MTKEEVLQVVSEHIRAAERAGLHPQVAFILQGLREDLFLRWTERED